jgi:hypothetical protein
MGSHITRIFRRKTWHTRNFRKILHSFGKGFNVLKWPILQVILELLTISFSKSKIGAHIITRIVVKCSGKKLGISRIFGKCFTRSENASTCKNRRTWPWPILKSQFFRTLKQTFSNKTPFSVRQWTMGLSMAFAENAAHVEFLVTPGP